MRTILDRFSLGLPFSGGRSLLSPAPPVNHPMHPLVRDLYRRCIIVGRQYPGGIAVVRKKAKEYFMDNKALATEQEIKRAVGHGRWYLREIIGVIKLGKYRAMKRRYGPH